MALGANAFDLIVTVALGLTLATILLSRDVSLVQGLLALLVLVGLQFAMTWSSVRWPAVSRIAKSKPTVLVLRGRQLPGAMQRERVVESELQAAVREKGHARPDEVALVVLETDGSLAVVGDAAHLDAHAPARRSEAS